VFPASHRPRHVDGGGVRWPAEARCEPPPRLRACQILLATSWDGITTSIRVTRDAEGPHAMGRVRDLLIFHWRGFLARSAPILNVNVDGP
jgi:hypothetical protein